MHQLAGAHHLAAVHLGDRLMAQAHPEGGNGGAQLAQHLQAHPRLIGVAGAGGDQDRVRAQGADLLEAEGIDLRQIDPADFRTQVGFVSQDPRLFNGSLRENVLLGRVSADASQLSEVARVTGLDRLVASHPQGWDLPVGEMGCLLSGGQRQRVALARAIVKRPKLLLLDEPLSALDRKVRAEMQLELKRLQHEVGITFVVVTHDQEEAMSMADRIAVMSAGRVEQIDSPIDLYQRPASLFVADFIGTSNRFDGTVAPGGVQVGDRVLPGTVHGPSPDGAAVLIVRPEDTRIVTEDAALLSGRVADSQFFGGTSTLAIEVAGHPSPVLHTRQGAPEAVRGQVVHLAWDAGRAVILPGEPPQA